MSQRIAVGPGDKVRVEYGLNSVNGGGRGHGSDVVTVKDVSGDFLMGTNGHMYHADTVVEVLERKPSPVGEPQKRNFLVYVQAEGLYWRADAQGYTKNLLEAGLYTVKEARELEAATRPGGTSPERSERAVPLESKRAELEKMRDMITTLLAAI
jgi:hypothetical protein